MIMTLVSAIARSPLMSIFDPPIQCLTPLRRLRISIDVVTNSVKSPENQVTLILPSG